MYDRLINILAKEYKIFENKDDQKQELKKEMMFKSRLAEIKNLTEIKFEDRLN